MSPITGWALGGSKGLGFAVAALVAFGRTLSFVQYFLIALYDVTVIIVG